MRIKLDGLTKYYEKNKILNSISLDIANVKVVGIIGESGCGKSTLLRQLTGIELADEGSITINGTSVNSKTLKIYQEKIGVVFQKHNLFPHLTVSENIILILTKIKGLSKSKAKEKCISVLEEFHLTDQSDKVPSKISGGQAQRASIARAISTEPDLLFLDEPTASLDPLLTKEVLNSIQQLKIDGVEFIFVTHEMDFLTKFADYFIFMDKGSIVEHGSIEKLKTPETEKLKTFVNR